MPTPELKYYWGYRKQTRDWQLFTADAGHAEPGARSGYDRVKGPYEDRKEALENDPNGREV